MNSPRSQAQRRGGWEGEVYGRSRSSLGPTTITASFTSGGFGSRKSGKRIHLRTGGEEVEGGSQGVEGRVASTSSTGEGIEWQKEGSNPLKKRRG